MLGAFGLVTVGAGSVLAAASTGQPIVLFQAFVLYPLTTLFLVLVAFAAPSHRRGAARALGAISSGLAVGVDWLLGGALAGAAMSPGRWLGPAVASGFFDNAWVYWAGPLLGGILGAVVYEYVFRPRALIKSA